MERKDYKLFLSLLLWTLVPSIYFLIRMNIVSINNVDINILGQMEWFDLIDEVLVTTLIVPLYSLLKPNKSSAKKNGFAFLLSFGIYCVFTFFISMKISTIAKFMQAEYATQYLLLQSLSMLINYIITFMVLLFTINDDYKTVNILLISKIILLCLFDYIFISKYADIGTSYSEIIVNTFLVIISVFLVLYKKYIAFGKCELSWIKDWGQIGLFSGIQIFLDNFIYSIMVCKMVNVVSESGNYWIANNFIWGWLLVPVSCIVEIIKKNDLSKLNFKNTWRWCIGIFILWIITINGWDWFIDDFMASDSKIILSIVYPLIPFYVIYIISAFLDAWFISKGKTIYTMIISLIVNIIYYGIVYILFKKGLFTMNINFIILMFGFGMIIHTIFSIIFYLVEQKRMNHSTT